MKINAAVARVSECDELSKPSEEAIKSDIGSAPVNDDLSVDLSELDFSSDVNSAQTCGPIRVMFWATNNDDVLIENQETTTIQVNVKCQSFESVKDVKLDVIYGTEEIPVIEPGDKNPFGETSQVNVDIGDCYMPKTVACLYCGFDFDSGRVGLDEETWGAISTIEVDKNKNTIEICYIFAIISYSAHYVMYIYISGPSVSSRAMVRR